jgi:hypothetical protein
MMPNSTATMATAAGKQRGDCSSSAELHALYPLALGEDWRNMDAGLRRFHCVTTPRHAVGVFNIQHGSNWPARLLASMFRLPAEGPGVPVSVAIHCEPRPQLPHGLVEVWDRTFGGQRLISRQWINSAGRLVERFGLMELDLMLSVETGALCFNSAGAAIAFGPLSVKMPRWLAPRVEARVVCLPSPASQFAVSVRLFHPILGLLLSYKGSIAPTDTQL